MFAHLAVFSIQFSVFRVCIVNCLVSFLSLCVLAAGFCRLCVWVDVCIFLFVLVFYLAHTAACELAVAVAVVALLARGYRKVNL